MSSLEVNGVALFHAEKGLASRSSSSTAFPLIIAHGIRSWILSPNPIERYPTVAGTRTQTPERVTSWTAPLRTTLQTSWDCWRDFEPRQLTSSDTPTADSSRSSSPHIIRRWFGR